MKKVFSGKIEQRLYRAFAVVALLVFVVIAMMVHIQALSSRIAVLESEVDVSKTQISSYGRTLCSNSPTFNGMNQATNLTKYTTQSGGYTRTYQVHTPDNYDSSVRYPVILSFDGIEGSGDRMELYSGLDELPAILVYPDALAGKRGFTAWQGAPYSLDGEQDIEFVGTILKEVPSRYCTDATRTFAVGMSNGGAFATIVGCELGNQIRAVASMSGAYYATCRPEQRTPSLLVLHSAQDKQAPFMGSVARQLPQIPQWADEQAVQRQCKVKEPATTFNSTRYYTWSSCSDNSHLQLVVLRAQAHGWLELPEAPAQRAEGSAGYIWKFFEASMYSN